MRALFLLTLVAACSSTGDALVVVTVSSSRQLSGIQKLHAGVTAAGHTKDFDVTPTSGAPFDIPQSKTFGVDIIDAYVGMFSITVDAVDKDGHTLASGAQSTTTHAGDRTDIEVMLGNPNDDGGLDGGDGCTPTSCSDANYGCGMLSTCGTMIDCGPCTLTAVHPAAASVGDTVILEGRFNPNLEAAFPGVPLVAMTLLGPNRATVKVPAGANSGALGVAVAGMGALGVKQPFRRLGFKPGLNAFHATMEQAESARPMPRLRDHQVNGAAAIVGGAVEVFGGFVYSGGVPSPLPTFSIASVNADGTVGVFTADPSRHLTQQRGGFALYNPASGPVVAGGYDGTTVFKSVESAAARADGSGSDSFTAGSVQLNTARAFPASAIIGPYFYVFGGTNNSDLSMIGLKTIERAPISATDGSLGAFEVVSVQTFRARIGAFALVERDKVYLIGGTAAGTSLSSIEEAAINGDGSIGAFSQSTGTALTIDRTQPGIVELGGTVYAIGGTSSAAGGGPSATIESAPINSDGTLGNFTGTSLTTVQGRTGQPLLVGDHLWYLHSGLTDGSSERASIVASGALGAWADSGRSLAAPRSEMSLAVVGSQLYMFGGQASMIPNNAIAHANIDADGNLGPILGTLAGNALPTLTTARSSAQVAVFDRDLYVCGGNGPASKLADCEHFVAGWDGMLTKSATTISSMILPRADFHLVALDDGLFAVGANSVERLPLDAGLQPSPTPAPWVGQSTTIPVSENSRAAVLIDKVHFLISGDAQPHIDQSAYASSALGNYVTNAISMPEWRFDGTLLSVGPRLVFAGGVVTNLDMGGGSMVSRATDHAVVQAGGFGNFADSGIQTLGPRRGGAGVVLGNSAWLIGGFDGNNPVGVVEQAPLQ